MKKYLFFAIVKYLYVMDEGHLFVREWPLLRHVLLFEIKLPNFRFELRVFARFDDYQRLSKTQRLKCHSSCLQLRRFLLSKN